MQPMLTQVPPEVLLDQRHARPGGGQAISLHPACLPRASNITSNVSLMTGSTR
ncbi:hypothetical protein ABIE65_005353 [Constrictibacter sp. MBR-5]|jgi:hypothetical protein